ncbi:MAG: response regulator [Bacteroidales bacterium]
MITNRIDTTLLIADDHKVFRQGLRNLFEIEKIAPIIGEAENGKECIELAMELNPDIILMDIDMPEMNGIEASERILEINPKTKIIVLSMHGDYDYYQQMVCIGVKGFIQKSSGIDEVITAVSTVAKGEAYFSSEILRSIIVNINETQNNYQTSQNTFGITKREMDVLNLICKGYTNEEIGKKIFISSATVKGHRSKLLSKTGAKNTALLIMFAVKNKLVSI